MVINMGKEVLANDIVSINHKLLCGLRLEKERVLER